MVDRTTLTILGSLVMVVGIGFAALSGRFAKSQSAYFQRLATQRPWVNKVPTFRLYVNEKFMRGLGGLVGIFVAVIGALWIAGVGTK